MRCLQFDKETIHALQALGFNVEDDKESASMEATVSVIHPIRDKHLSVDIWLSCGGTLHFELTHERVQRIAARYNEEAMEHSYE
jgi:hypothetical protein